MWLPKVSIIIPVYNGSNYLKEAIDSAINQTYQNIEIIVVNDGSNDEKKTEKIALSYGDKISYLTKENGGVSSALNLGITNMTGEYFSWLSHDDVYLPNKIEAQIEALRPLAEKKTVILSDTVQINAKSELMPNGRLQRNLPYNVLIDGNSTLVDMYKHGSFNGCALLIHKDLLNECNLFDERYRFTQDFLLWTSIFAKGYSLLYIPKLSVYMRVHSSQVTQTSRRRFYEESLASSKDIVSLLLENPNNNNLLYYFANYNAMYNNTGVVQYVVDKGKELDLLPLSSIIEIRMMQLFGKIRPLLRKIYYKLVKRVNTQ